MHFFLSLSITFKYFRKTVLLVCLDLLCNFACIRSSIKNYIRFWFFLTSGHKLLGLTTTFNEIHVCMFILSLQLYFISTEGKFLVYYAYFKQNSYSLFLWLKYKTNALVFAKSSSLQKSDTCILTLPDGGFNSNTRLPNSLLIFPS